MKIYSIFDLKAELFATSLSVHVCDIDAIRLFHRLLNDPNQGSVFARYPEDFSLYQVGDYVLETGEVKGYIKPKLVCMANQVESFVKGE